MRCGKFVSGFCLFTFVLMLTSCKEEKKPAFAPVVGVVRVKTESIPLEFESAGKIYGALDIQVRAQVGGILKERRFVEGQYVNKGESLFLIDPLPYQAALSRAEGNLAQAESEQRRTDRDFKRMAKLFKSGAVSRKEYDDSLSAVERATANLKVAQAELQTAKINLEYTDVKAPISGFVRRESQTIGNLVSVAGESSLLTSMVQIDPVKVQFSVAGSFWRQIRSLKGESEQSIMDSLQVHVLMPDGTTHPDLGKIIFVDNTEDPQTSTITIKAEIPNSEHKLMPGQFVRVRVTGRGYQRPVIPNSCILASPNENIVYVIDAENNASIRPVDVKLMENNCVVIKGLKDGEVVVSEGLIKVRDKAKVTPVFKDVINK